jgi:hypothetical protein
MRERLWELSRLLLTDGSAERRIVSRWVTAVEQAVEQAVSKADPSLPSSSAADLAGAASEAGAVERASAAAADGQASDDGSGRSEGSAGGSGRSNASNRGGRSASGGAAAVTSTNGAAAAATTAQLVLPYIEHISSRLLQLSGAPKPCAPAAFDLTARVMLPLVEGPLLQLSMVAFAAEDRELAEQQRRMRALSPKQLHADAYVATDASGRPELTPLAGALALISGLSYLQAPSDYAARVARAVKAVAAACEEAGCRDVSADDLVGVMVVVVVHAELPHGYSLLQHAKQYLDAGTSRSELGYCMCTFELALEYVRCCHDGDDA